MNLSTHKLTYKILADYEQVPIPVIKKSNFRYAFLLLPSEKRIAISNIYTICSYLDDIVDCEDDINYKNNINYGNNINYKNNIESNTNDIKIIKKQRLDWWKTQIKFIYEGKKNDYLQPLSQTIEKFQIPLDYFEILIDGIGRDIQQNSYNTFTELLDYCYGVASIIGLMSICIFLYEENKQLIISNNIKNYAINLGYALQLTNIMRDVKVDAARNYFYLPNEDLLKFDYSQQNILECKYNANFVALMEFQYNRTMQYYKKTEELLKSDYNNLNYKYFRSSEMMHRIYFRLLQEIKKRNYNIYIENITIPKFEKLKSFFF